MTFDANGTKTAQGYYDNGTPPVLQPLTGAIDYADVQPAGAAASLGLTVDYGSNTRQTASPFTVKTFNQTAMPPASSITSRWIAKAWSLPVSRTARRRRSARS